MSQKMKLDVVGMSCTSCAAAIEKALNNTNGVKKADVDFPGKKVVIDTDGSVKGDELIKVIKDTGFDAVIA